MPEITNCPSCERKVKVPETLMGKKVKCPSCGTVFTAAPAAPAGFDPLEQDPYIFKEEQKEEEPVRKRKRVPDDEDDEEEGDEEPEEREPKPRRIRPKRVGDLSALKAPAITLLVVGILSLLFNLWMLFGLMRARSQPMPARPDLNAQQQEIYKKTYDLIMGPIGFPVGGICTLFSILTILGSIMMLQGKMRGLALAGSIVAMFNFCGCCVFGIPFGIWALVALNRSDVVAAYK